MPFILSKVSFNFYLLWPTGASHSTNLNYAIASTRTQRRCSSESLTASSTRPQATPSAKLGLAGRPSAIAESSS